MFNILSEQDDIGFDDTPTIAAVRYFFRAVLKICKIIYFAAVGAHTNEFFCIAMNGDYVATAGLQMQIINILRNDALNHPLLLKLCQYVMGFTGRYGRKMKILSIKAVKLVGMRLKEININDTHDLVFTDLPINSLFAAKIRNPCFGADTSTGHHHGIF